MGNDKINGLNAKTQKNFTKKRHVQDSQKKKAAGGHSTCGQISARSRVGRVASVVRSIK